MALHYGKEGVVKIGTVTIAEVKEFALDVSSDTVDTTSINTAFTNGGYRTFGATLLSWEGSVTCFWDETDTTGQVALVPGATVALKLYPEGDQTGDTFYSGNAIITKVSRKVALENAIEAEFSFKGTGALTTATV